MRKFIIGLIVGLILGGTLAYAATRITLEDASNNIIGTTANPLQVKIQ